MASFQIRLLGRAAADLARIQVEEVQGRFLQKRKNKGGQKERVHISGPSTSAEKRFLWRGKHKARGGGGWKGCEEGLGTCCLCPQWGRVIQS